MKKNMKKKWCDCKKKKPIVERSDGLRLCLNCRVELALTGGKFCLAFAERNAAGWHLEDYTPSQGTAPIVPFNRAPRPKQYFSRRWQEERDAS